MHAHWSNLTKLCIVLMLQIQLSRQSYVGSELHAPSVHGLAAGILGNFAGAQSGGEALLGLESGSPLSSGHEEVSEHEISGATDYGYSGGEEYAEAAASEGHEQYEAPQFLGKEYDAIEHGHIGGLDLELDSKPVPGIDHGKNAFSYSTLYEFKDREHSFH
ncbi:uncharacterized protein LOC115633397 [Scaptodrosophila lebanonensis]|uniref:Uncharacterized protein LOC115633397 n=1 Tax=Drosophila lebanonensis TaxID=7225 RepID=A0A6J2UEX7_DROLE|nr:uncharacterized protein LOC115633397 [Scaptodrosophila lebanonensis]